MRKIFQKHAICETRNFSVICFSHFDLNFSTIFSCPSKLWERGNEEQTGAGARLVVMGGDCCYKGCEFESWHRILDGHFSHLFVEKIVICVWKDDNKLKKRPRMAHFLEKNRGTNIFHDQSLTFCLNLSLSLSFSSDVKLFSSAFLSAVKM